MKITNESDQALSLSSSLSLLTETQRNTDSSTQIEASSPELSLLQDSLTETQVLPQSYSYKRKDGTTEYARDEAEAIKLCPVLGKIAMQNPKLADLILKTSRLGQSILDEREQKNNNPMSQDIKSAIKDKEKSTKIEASRTIQTPEGEVKFASIDLSKPLEERLVRETNPVTELERETEPVASTKQKRTTASNPPINPVENITSRIKLPESKKAKKSPNEATTIKMVKANIEIPTQKKKKSENPVQVAINSAKHKEEEKSAHKKTGLTIKISHELKEEPEEVHEYYREPLKRKTTITSIDPVQEPIIETLIEDYDEKVVTYQPAPESLELIRESLDDRLAHLDEDEKELVMPSIQSITRIISQMEIIEFEEIEPQKYESMQKELEELIVLILNTLDIPYEPEDIKSFVETFLLPKNKVLKETNAELEVDLEHDGTREAKIHFVNQTSNDFIANQSPLHKLIGEFVILYSRIYGNLLTV